MSLRMMSRYEDEEGRPKKCYALYKNGDHQWWVTLTLQTNLEAKAAGQPCIENEIFSTKKPSNRKKALTGLFRHVNFLKVHYIDDTITRIHLHTNIGHETQSWQGFSVSEVLHHPLPPFMSIELHGLQYSIDEDESSVI